ncbi:MAG: hypothetical protein RB191_19525 [Terriglobia bacterium]|nr:hypothetical protein [Terriglobia bacterium]
MPPEKHNSQLGRYRRLRNSLSVVVVIAAGAVGTALVSTNVETFATENGWNLWLTRIFGFLAALGWLRSWWFAGPVLILMGIVLTLWTFPWWSKFWIDQPDSPLRLVLDPANPGGNFWNDARREYSNNAGGYAYGWEYRVKVENDGPTTLDNIVVSYEDTDDHRHLTPEDSTPFTLDPGQHNMVTLFFSSIDYDDNDETSDPVAWNVAIRATARDAHPAVLQVRFEPSPRGHDDEAGPYRVSAHS